MKETRIIMGMPITIEVVDASCTNQNIHTIFSYFTYIDEKFSTFKEASEISKINAGLIKQDEFSEDMKVVFLLCDKTKQKTEGYFDIVNNNGIFDPSGLVKGWAIYNAALLLKKAGFENFYVEAGGDIQVYGKNKEAKPWKVGIKNPFNQNQIIKVVQLSKNEGVATSGNYERGAHIYNPKQRNQQLAEIVSLTVIGPNIYEADRFATAAFAMQKEGIHFIETLSGFEGYMIDKNGVATMTTHFKNYV